MNSHHVGNPFPGLRPFETDEYRLFFGREGQSDELIERLARTHFLAVVGPSGSGKSSLIRAGLLPALRGGLAFGDTWRVALMRPGANPVGNLAAALAASGSDSAAADEAEEVLRRSSLGLIEYVRRSRVREGESVLIVVEQFEELFRFAYARGEDYADHAAAFVKRLLEAAHQNEVPVHVLLTMRSDFIGDCNMFRGLPEAINEGQHLMPRMSRDQLRQAITGPVAVSRAAVAPQLVNRLLNDVGDNPDQLPILQHALMRTWDYWAAHRRDGEPIGLEHYEAVGTMADALSRHADEAYYELPDERVRRIAERLFKALTEKGTDNREIRRPTLLREAIESSGAAEREALEVVEVFRRDGRSFLMPPAGIMLTPDTMIDISHESLIRNWDRLKMWTAEEVESARMYNRIAETAVLYESSQAGLWRDPDLQFALDWRERTQPTAAWALRYNLAFDSAMKFLDASIAARDAEEMARRRGNVRRQPTLAAGLAIMFLVVLIVAAYAWSARRAAVASAHSAEDERMKAVAALKDAEAARQEAENARRELKEILNERELNYRRRR